MSKHKSAAKAGCLHCDIWAAITKRLPVEGGQRVLDDAAAYDAMSSAAEVIGELLCALDESERQGAFEVLMEIVVKNHDQARGKAPPLDAAGANANVWLM